MIRLGEATGGVDRRVFDANEAIRVKLPCYV